VNKNVNVVFAVIFVISGSIKFTLNQDQNNIRLILHIYCQMRFTCENAKFSIDTLCLSLLMYAFRVLKIEAS